MSLLEMAPSLVLSVIGVLETRKAVMCLREKMHVRDKLHSGMGYSVRGHEFQVDESTVGIK